MFYDFPTVKLYLKGQLLRETVRQIPQHAPLLAKVGVFYQHEGKNGVMRRADQSTDEMTYPRSEFPFDMSREEMKTMDLSAVLEKLTILAQRMADARQRMLLAKASQAAESVGNVVDVGGDFRQEHFLEMLSKVYMEFDLGTGQLSANQTFVPSDPTVGELLQRRLQEWGQDPEFRKKYEDLIDLKREEWRAREDNRKLVD